MIISNTKTVVIIVFLVSITVFVSGTTSTDVVVVVGGDSESKIECLLVQIDLFCGDDVTTCLTLENDGWVCEDEHGVTHALKNLPPGFMTTNKGLMHSGETVLSITTSSSTANTKTVTKNEIIVDFDDKISLQDRSDWFRKGRNNNNNHGIGTTTSENNRMFRGRSNNNNHHHQGRRLYPKIGTSTVLVVYVNGQDVTPTVDFDTVVDDILGTNGDTINLVTQYAACSGNQLNFVPAEDPDDGVTGGAVSITLPQNIFNVSTFTVRDWVDNYIVENNHNWLINFDHVMYVMPAATYWPSGVLGYATVNTPKSVYYDFAAGWLYVHMHEIGHNLGFSHSGRGTLTYGDDSGFMGNAANGGHETNRNGPIMCFNGAKSWFTGWYSAGHEEITAAGFDGQLVGVDDFNRGLFDYNAGDRVILKIPHPNNSTEDLYVMYNRAKGINFESKEGRDKVLVVSSPPLEDIYGKSWLSVELDTVEGSNIYVSEEHGIDGSRLVIQVIDMFQYSAGTKDFATVSVYYDHSPTAAPTACADGLLEIELKTDGWPGDTSWEVREQDTNTVVVSRSEYTQKNTVHNEKYCLNGSGPYVFTIHDSFHDGLCCAHGEGYFQIKFNGVPVYDGGDFGGTDSVVFSFERDASSTSPPTLFPTFSPTLLPTPPPTPLQTPSPTPPPTPPPTQLPTPPPTPPPTSSPTPPLTLVPTPSLVPLPTSPPTLLPTLPPTPLPTPSPSAPTTLPPTPLPTSPPTPLSAPNPATLPAQRLRE